MVLLETFGRNVGNTGDYEYAAPFTTGTHPYGYTISEVVFPLSSRNSNAGPVVVTIRERTSGNRPGNLVATLNNPSTFVVAFDVNQNTFTAPPGTTLSPNTTYYLVFNDRNAGTQPIHSAGRHARASRGGGKSDGLNDWDIPNLEMGSTKALRRRSPNDSWEERSQGLEFSISGSPIDIADVVSVVDNTPPPGAVCDGKYPAQDYWQWPRGYCIAKQTTGADSVGTTGRGMVGKPAAFIESGAGEFNPHGQHALYLRGATTGTIRIRTLHWRFSGVTNPTVWVTASPDAEVLLAGTAASFNGGIAIPVAPHDGEQVIELGFTIGAGAKDFEFELLPSRNASQRYNMLGWFEGRAMNSTYDWVRGPSIRVYVEGECPAEKGRCAAAPTPSNSPPEPQSSQPPDAVGEGQPAVNPGGVPSDDESPYAAVLADAEKAVAETDKGEIHVDRWRRVLAALGVDNGHTPMPASEAQGYVDRGWTRWVPVAVALAAIEEEAANPQPETEVEPSTDTTDNTPDPVVEPAACVSDELVNDVRGYSEETVSTDSELQSAYVERWLRVLQTFNGTANDATIMTPAEAQTYVDRGWVRWEPVLKAIQCLADQA